MEGQHAAILRAAISTGRGTEVSTEGDSFFAVFPTPGGAIRAVREAQHYVIQGFTKHPPL